MNERYSLGGPGASVPYFILAGSVGGSAAPAANATFRAQEYRLPQTQKTRKTAFPAGEAVFRAFR
ncbi:MAG: hypothetical protein WKG07_30215 [Hymenobacter sp.]